MKRTIICLLFATLLLSGASATHLRGGQISIKQLDKTNLTCRITITVYTKTIGTSVLFGGTQAEDGDLLDFGDGTPRHLVTEVGPEKTPNGSTYFLIDAVRGIARATYTIDHTYATPGSYTITYQEPNRNDGVLNFDQSVNTPFYLESSFTLDPFNDKTYTSPIFLSEPIFFVATESDFTYSMAAQDSNDYQLLYELVTPKMNEEQDVLNYKLPDSFTINQFNGLISWDTQFQGFNRPGEYGFAVKVYQIQDRHIVGFMIRDFQIILEEADFSGSISDNLDLDDNNRIYIPTGNSFTFKVFAEDSGVSSLTLFSELSSHTNSFSFTTYDSIQGTQNIKVGLIVVTSSAELLRNNPYSIVVRGTYRSGQYEKDLGYLLYTKDVEIPGFDTILEVGEEDPSIKVYPNPTKDFLKIEHDDYETKTIKLFSVSGELVIERKNSKEDILDLRSLPPGVYQLHIESRGFSQKTFRILKTN